MIHLIHGPNGPITPVGIEHAAGSVPGVTRAAAVGVGPPGTQAVIVVIETAGRPRRPQLASDEISDQIRDSVGVDVAAVLEVPALPVDKRHNSKIDRTKVAAWAESILAGARVRSL
jgi:acyl-coenzyme A synthetase/AMP-(fatty) acid ligase